MASTETVVGASSGAEKEKSLIWDRKYKFWFTNQDGPRGIVYNPRVYPCETSDDFWFMHYTVFVNFPSVAVFHLLKDGMTKPPANSGKWTAICNTSTLVGVWWTSMVAVVGEVFDDADGVLGMVVSVHDGAEHEIALWTENASDKNVQMSIGRKWKKVLRISNEFVYKFRADGKIASFRLTL